ncbi:MAG: Dihydrolipoyllysine-residue succinyltransferase component of 2-oxoglutarate dehydrogenase complex [Desulfovibrio sp.]
MAKRIIMPKQGLQMTEGTIMQWLVREGEPVTAGTPLFEMETDKLTITIESSESGTLLKIVRAAGETVPITEIIAIVGEPGEDISALLSDAPRRGEAAPTLPAVAAPAAQPAACRGGSTGFASPRAKTRAAELKMDWSKLCGSSPQGWVIERDVLAAAEASQTTPPLAATPLARKVAARSGVDLADVRGTGPRGKIRRADVEAMRADTKRERTIIPLRGMRKVIAERMKQSQEINAQTTHRISVRMAEATRMREALKAAGRKISFNDIVALSVARALAEHPLMNVELMSEGIWRKDFVNLGLAVAMDEGLLVPVVKNADLMNLDELSHAMKDLAAGAREGRLSPDDYTGGSFTISNLGMFGLEEFTAIINPPESGILAIGAVENVPVAVGSAVEVQPVMKLTLSYDHRVIDGAPAAAFLGTVKRYLETPYFML